MKDLIIVRGVNCYAHDVEHVVEHASPLIRRGGVVAFEIEQQTATGLAVVAEVRRRSALPDLYEIAVAVKHQLNVAIGGLRWFHRTASLKRRPARRCGSGRSSCGGAVDSMCWVSWRRLTKRGRAPTQPRSRQSTRSRPAINSLGIETCSLLDSGMDSLDLVRFMHELQELLNRKGENLLARALDTQLLQHITVADVFRVAELPETAPEVTTQ